MNIGVGVTTYNRPERLAATLEAFRKYSPDIPVVVVNDGGTLVDLDAADTVVNLPENHGIAYAKNRCIEMLTGVWGVEHLFLFDDDTMPTAEDWWEPYVDSPHPHLMYQFPAAPSHWRLTETWSDEKHVAYDKARGCMLYVTTTALEHVGGMHLAFGKHGGEHEDWSLRIHEAGLTPHPFMDVRDPSIRCADQDERGISSVDYAESKWWKLVDRTRLTRFANVDASPVPVLVPYRSDGGHRDELWDWTLSNFWGHLAFRVVAGRSPDGPFNRSAAVNDAATKAATAWKGNWEVAVIADSDAWVPAQNLDAAIRKAREAGKLVAAFDHVIELDRDTTQWMMHYGPQGLDHTKTERVRTGDMETQSLVLVVPRPLWEAVGGFDERFQSWGAEDNAFWKACEVVGGKPERIPGPAYHLWHPSGAPVNKAADPLYRANWDLWCKYRQVRTVDDLRRI